MEKWRFFHLFFLGNIGQENAFYDILERKNTCLGYKNKKLKVEKLTSFQRGEHLVLVEKWRFFHLFFLGNIGQENAFYDILERKNTCLGYKNKKLKVEKLTSFQRGEHLVLVEKWRFFHLFFLVNIGQENAFYDILERKDTCLGYKNKKFKVEKLTSFPRGEHLVLVQKWPVFQLFFLGNIGQENVFYDILERINPF